MENGGGIPAGTRSTHWVYGNGEKLVTEIVSTIKRMGAVHCGDNGELCVQMQNKTAEPVRR